MGEFSQTTPTTNQRGCPKFDELFGTILPSLLLSVPFALRSIVGIVESEPLDPVSLPDTFPFLESGRAILVIGCVEILGSHWRRTVTPILASPLARLCNGDRTREDDDGSLICQLLSGCQFWTGGIISERVR